MLDVTHLASRKEVSERMAKKKAKKQWTASEMGKKGGPARKKALTPERRSAIAKKAAASRWNKAKEI